MAGKVYEFAIQLGSKMSSGFNKPFMSAASNINKLGKNLKDLNKKQARIDSFKSLKRDIHDTHLQFKRAQSEVSKLGTEMQKTAKPTKALKKQFQAAQNKANGLKTKLYGQRQELTQLKGALSAAGVSTKGLRGEQERLAKQIEKTSRVQKKLQEIQGRKQANLQKRSEYRGKMMGAVGLAASLAAPVAAAISAQEAEIRLSTVINDSDQQTAMKKARAISQQMAKSGLVGLREGYDIQYALNSAGLEAEAARSAALVVAKVAKVTSGVPEQVGEVIATTYNNLGQQLTGTTEEKMGRLGDLLTKVQFKYQIRDFSQLGDSLREGAAGMANYNVNLDQGVTLLGQLNSAGLQGSRAGTALNAVLRQMSKAQEEWGIQIKRNEKGELDMIATLQEIENALDGLDADERAAAIQDIFGDEGAKGLVPLLNKLDELDGALREVSEGSKGIVDKEVQKFLSGAQGQLNALKGSVTVLAATLGRVLLPGVTAVSGGVAKGASALASFSDKFPFATKLIVGATTALVGLKIATIAGGYAWTFIKGGALSAASAFNSMKSLLLTLKNRQIGLTAVQKKNGIVTAAMKVKTIALAAAQKAAAAAQWLFNAALSANPIGLVIAGIAGLVAAGVLLYKNWEKVSKWFKGFWSNMKAGFANLAGAISEKFKSIFEGLAKKIEWFKEKWAGLKSTLGFGKDEKTQKREAQAAWETYSAVPGYASGTIARRPHLAMVAEEGSESIIPHDPTKRGRAIALWQKTGEILGAKEAGDSINLTFAPNITITGTGNADIDLDRALKKVSDDLIHRLESMRRDERRLSFS